MKKLYAFLCILTVGCIAFSVPLRKKRIETSPKGKTMIDIGIDEKARKQITGVLKILLADEYTLFTKLYKYHWNVCGKHFGPLHKLFEEQYESLFEKVDLVAERIRILGFEAPGTMKEFLEMTHIQENPGYNPSGCDMIADLLADHQAIIKYMRVEVGAIEDFGDLATVDMISGLLEDHEKMAWMLRAHLECARDK